MNDTLRELLSILGNEHAGLLELVKLMLVENRQATSRITEAVLRNDEHSRVCKVCEAEKVLAGTEKPIEDVPF